jgi:hypothetical protein
LMYAPTMQGSVKMLETSYVPAAIHDEEAGPSLRYGVQCPIGRGERATAGAMQGEKTNGRFLESSSDHRREMALVRRSAACPGGVE